MSRRRRITSKGRELIKKRSYYDRYTLRPCRPRFSKKGRRMNPYCLLRRSKSKKRKSKSKKRRSKSKKRKSKSKKRRSKRDGMDKPVISWRSLPKTPGGIPLNQGFEEYKIDWTGYKTKRSSRPKSREETKRRQAAYAKWKEEEKK